jgi:hypothetical protein
MNAVFPSWPARSFVISSSGLNQHLARSDYNCDIYDELPGSRCWHSASQGAEESGVRLCQVPDPKTLKGKRDRLLGVLLGCGLRRKEAAELDVTDLQRRQDHWAIADLAGKGRPI